MEYPVECIPYTASRRKHPVDSMTQSTFLKQYPVDRVPVLQYSVSAVTSNNTFVEYCIDLTSNKSLSFDVVSDVTASSLNVNKHYHVTTTSNKDYKTPHFNV